MARYKMDDGTVMNTRKAQKSWEEATRWDGHNHLSVATGSQWDHETLYVSAKGRYYIERTSQWQGSTPSARFVEPREAAAWLLQNGHDIPEDLEDAADEVEE
jgi:hypothetical protein